VRSYEESWKEECDTTLFKEVVTMTPTRTVTRVATTAVCDATLICSMVIRVQ